MADNYLERKMEEYRVSALSRKSMHRPVYGVKPGTVVLPYPSKRIAVIGGNEDLVVSVVRAFRNADCRVSFCNTDLKNGSVLAQQSGARFYPCEDYSVAGMQHLLSLIGSAYGDVDVVVWLADNAVSGVDSFSWCDAIPAALNKDSKLICIYVSSSNIDAVPDKSFVLDQVKVPRLIDQSKADIVARVCVCLTMPGMEAGKGQMMDLS